MGLHVEACAQVGVRRVAVAAKRHRTEAIIERVGYQLGNRVMLKPNECRWKLSDSNERLNQWMEVKLASSQVKERKEKQEERQRKFGERNQVKFIPSLVDLCRSKDMGHDAVVKLRQKQNSLRLRSLLVSGLRRRPSVRHKRIVRIGLKDC